MKKIVLMLLALVGMMSEAHAQESYLVTLADGYDTHAKSVSLSAVNLHETEPVDIIKSIANGENPPIEIGATVTLTITPADGYVVGEVTAETWIDTRQMHARRRSGTVGNPSLGIDVALTKGEGNTWTFTMPEANVELTVKYAKVVQSSWISVAEGTYTYNGQAFTPDVTVVDGTTSVNSYFNVSYSDNVNAGDATVTVTAKAGQTDYAGTASTTFTIGRASVTVSADDKSKVYGEDDPELTATVTGLIGEDKVTYALSRAAGEIVGEYAITATGDAEQGNYTVTYTAGKLTISSGTLSGITAKGYEGTYDGQKHGISFEGLNGETVFYGESASSCTGTDAPEYSDAGEYTVYYKISKANFADFTGSAAVKISRKAVTVTADDKSKTYGEEDPTLTATVTGLIGEDKVEYTLSRAEGKNVGEYAITASGDAEQGNYTVSYEDGIFSITEDDLTGVSFEDVEVTYDGQPHTVSISIPEGAEIFFLGGMPDHGKDEGNKDIPNHSRFRSVADNGQYTLRTAPSYQDVGEYTVNFKVTMDNYRAYYDEVKVTINPKAVTVTADDKSKTYGEDDPTLTATVTGLIGEDKVTYALSRAAGEIVGEYAITATGDEVQGNYTVSYIPGKLTITEAEITGVEVKDVEVTYDGQPHTVEVTNTPEATIRYKDADGQYTLKNAPNYKNVGKYTVDYQITKDGYTTTTGSATVTISPREVSVTDGLIAEYKEIFISGNSIKNYYIDCKDAVLDGKVEGDELGISGVKAGKVEQKDGQYIVDIDYSNAELTGQQAANYTLDKTNSITQIAVTKFSTSETEENEGGGTTETTTQTTIGADGSTTEYKKVVEKDKDGKFAGSKESTIRSEKGADGSTVRTEVSVTKDASGSVINITKAEVTIDVSGATQSEHSVSLTNRADGSSIEEKNTMDKKSDGTVNTSSSLTVKDGKGEITYEETKEKVTQSDGSSEEKKTETLKQVDEVKDPWVYDDEGSWYWITGTQQAKLGELTGGSDLAFPEKNKTDMLIFEKSATNAQGEQTMQETSLVAQQKTDEALADASEKLANAKAAVEAAQKAVDAARDALEKAKNGGHAEEEKEAEKKLKDAEEKQIKVQAIVEAEKQALKDAKKKAARAAPKAAMTEQKKGGSVSVRLTCGNVSLRGDGGIFASAESMRRAYNELKTRRRASQEDRIVPEGYIEIESGVEYEVLKDGPVILTFLTQDGPIEVTKITVTEPVVTPGDANGDGLVNAADIVEMVNAKAGKASDRFILRNADIDGDGEITQTDIDEVAKLVMR